MFPLFIALITFLTVITYAFSLFAFVVLLFIGIFEGFDKEGYLIDAMIGCLIAVPLGFWDSLKKYVFQ